MGQLNRVEVSSLAGGGEKINLMMEEIIFTPLFCCLKKYWSKIILKPIALSVQ